MLAITLWVTTKPIGLGDRKSPSLENLTLVQLDLILGEKIYNQDKYSLLTKIAPTLLFSDAKNPNEPQSWQQDIQAIAKALDREAQAEKPVLQTYPLVFLISSDLITQVYSQPESTTGRLLKEIGFEIVEPSDIRPDTIGDPEISWEILPQIETDIIVLSYSSNNFFNPESVLREKWAKNSLLNSMPVSQQGRVYFVGYQLWGSRIRGPLSDKLILEALPDLLLKSIEKSE